MKVVGYVRVSTDMQEKSGLGIEDQQHKIRSYCDLHEHELVEIITESASAAKTNRPGLKRALDMASSGKVQGVVVKKLDRLTRSVAHLGRMMDKHFLQGVSLMVIEEAVDTTNAAGRMTANMLMVVAQWERETISERTRAALSAKRRRGEKTGGGVPFGFKSKTVRKNAEEVVITLVKDPREQEVVDWIGEQRDAGKGYFSIASEMNRLRIRSKTGKRWSAPMVRKVYLRAIREGWGNLPTHRKPA